jgi:hypothetical protein
LPFIAWRAWNANRSRTHKDENKTFRHWARDEFDIGQEHVSGATAAIEILLPLAAVTFGMLAFAMLAAIAS